MRCHGFYAAVWSTRMPEAVADGNLNGDYYFVRWHQSRSTVSCTHPTCPITTKRRRWRPPRRVPRFRRQGRFCTKATRPHQRYTLVYYTNEGYHGYKKQCPESRQRKRGKPLRRHRGKDLLVAFGQAEARGTTVYTTQTITLPSDPCRDEQGPAGVSMVYIDTTKNEFINSLGTIAMHETQCLV